MKFLYLLLLFLYFNHTSSFLSSLLGFKKRFILYRNNPRVSRLIQQQKIKEIEEKLSDLSSRIESFSMTFITKIDAIDSMVEKELDSRNN